MPTTIKFPFIEAVLHFPGGKRFHRPLVWMEYFALYLLADDIRAVLSGELNQSESTSEGVHHGPEYATAKKESAGPKPR